MAVAGFYLAWVDAGETTFGVEHQRKDEIVVTLSRELVEGDIPNLTITVRNPRIGLLNIGRKQWAWVAYYKGNLVTPVFFGQLVGIPTDLLGEAVTLIFRAMPLDYLDQQQALAESLKIEPGYDPLFIEPKLRDDPNTVLEGWPLLWDMNPVTLRLSATDYLNGEDGEEVFVASEVPYESVNIAVELNPPRAVKIDATVNWTQTATGTVEIIKSRTFVTYTGDGIMSDWPKPLASLGSGWAVEAATAVDVLGVADAITASWSSRWVNGEKEHINGDVLSVNFSSSVPQLAGSSTGYILTEHNQIGFFDPFNDPQVNIPASYQNTSVAVPLWQIDTTLSLRYDPGTSRQRSERLRFTLVADLQDLLTASPAGTEDAETITLNGSDVGLPLLDVLNWETVKGGPVAVGTIIASGDTFQICIGDGIAGDEEPEFSDIVGDTAIDGTVTWMSLGTTLFSPDVPDWIAGGDVGAAQVIFLKGVRVIPYTTLLPPWPVPAEGVPVAEGLVVRPSNALSYQVCSTPGRSGIVEPNWNAPRGSTTSDGDVVWTSLGSDIAGIGCYEICAGPGISAALRPEFSATPGDITFDGSVTWMSLGGGPAFIGIPIGDRSRRSFFSSDRGQRSIKYFTSKGRAHLALRARAVAVTFDCRFERAMALTCRKSARVFDRRLPGGNAVGKITKVTLSAAGGKFIGTVTIGCAIGRGGAIEADDGTPSYVEEGYVARGYQYYEGGIVPLPSGDIGYSRPIDAPADDGLVFPLTREQVVISEQVHGSLAEQGAAIMTGFGAEHGLANLNTQAGSPQQSVDNQRYALELNKRNLSAMLRANPIWYELKLKPVGGASFNTEYDIAVTKFLPPKHIDLSAAAS